MNKRDFLKTLDVASLIAIAVSTVLVFIYQMVGTYQVIKFALIMYTASFLILTAFYGLKTFFVFAKTKEDGVIMFEMQKKDKALLLTKLALSVIAFVFTLVILILY